MRVRWLIIAVLGMGAPVGTGSHDRTISRRAGVFVAAPWLEDFEQLQREMSAHYANLEWALDARRMDLPRLREETETALRGARDEADARRALAHFVDAFGDGHLEIDWPAANSPQAAGTQPTDRCEGMGYGVRGGRGVDFSLVPEFVSLGKVSETVFPGGLFRLRRGGPMGIVRIAVFTPKAFPEACRQAVQLMGIAAGAVCDSDCQDRIEVRAANVLTVALLQRVEELEHAGATAILIDITHNGGGSDWVGALPRAVSPKPLHDSRLAFLKHAHWTTQLRDALRDVQADLGDARGSGDVLRNAARILEEAITESQQACDRSDVWVTGTLRCSLLVSDLLYSSGVLPEASPGSLARLRSRAALFHPARYDYRAGGTHLPLYVLVDGETWSAAEYFAAVLQDNHAATIIGELTGGAGCGYTNGGIPTELKNSKAQVKMPDCVRFRADGTNEVNGVKPDVLIAWARRDSPYQRAAKLVAVLEALR